MIKNIDPDQFFELQRVIDITRNIKTYFKNASCPKIIINAGGASQDYQISLSDRGENIN